MAEIGPGVRGGNNRQALTDEDGEGRRLFQRWCEDAGMTVKVDGMGTMFARREGDRPVAAAGGDRQPPRHPADRRAL